MKKISLSKFIHNKKIILTVLVVLMLGAGSTCYFLMQSKTLPKNSFTFLSKDNSLNYISAKGNVDAENIHDIYSDVNVQISEVNFKEGDEVHSGDILASSDTKKLNDDLNVLKESYDASLKMKKAKLDETSDAYDNAVSTDSDDSNASLVEAQTKQANAKIDMENKEKLYNSYESLYQAGAISEKDYRDAKDAYFAAKNNYDGATSSISSIKQSLSFNITKAKDEYNEAKAAYEDDSDKIKIENTEKDIQNSEIKSPYDGIITAVNISAGQASAGNTLFKIADDSSLIVTAKVKEADIAKVQIGQETEITTDSNGNESLDGTVTKIKNTPKKDADPLSLKDDSTDDDKEYEVTIKIDEPNDNLKIGMNADVKIKTSDDTSSYTVPSECIAKDDDDDYFIYQAKKNGKSYIVARIDIKKGSESDSETEVFSDDINDDTIVINDPLSYKEGDTFKISL